MQRGVMIWLTAAWTWAGGAVGLEVPSVLVAPEKAHAVLTGEWAYTDWFGTAGCLDRGRAPGVPEFPGLAENVVRFAPTDDGKGLVLTKQRRQDDFIKHDDEVRSLTYETVIVDEAAGHMTITLGGYRLAGRSGPSTVLVVLTPQRIVVLQSDDPWDADHPDTEMSSRKVLVKCAS